MFLEPSTPFQTLVQLVDALDITKEKIHIFDLPLEKNITSTLESQKSSAETYDPSLGVKFIQATDPDIKSKPHFRKNCKYCHKSTQSVPKKFRKQREAEERKPNT